MNKNQWKTTSICLLILNSRCLKLKTRVMIPCGPFVTELAGYRDQLAKPYLQNRKVIESQVQEAYDHTINEVNASHIMVKLPANPSPADTLKAYKKIMDIRKRIMAGESFEKIAREESDDPSAKQNEGRLGWFSAFMMVFPFENAAYHTPVGSVSMPVRSKLRVSSD